MFQVLFSTVFKLVFLAEGTKWMLNLSEAKSSDFTFIPDEYWSSDFSSIIMPELVIWFNSDGSIKKVLEMTEGKIVELVYKENSIRGYAYYMEGALDLDKVFTEVEVVHLTS